MMDIRKISYFHATVADRAGVGSAILEGLAKNGVNLMAFSATPTGPVHTQMVLFPEDDEALLRAASKEGLTLIGPHHALLVEGEDRIGALDAIHRKLYDAKIQVFATTAIVSPRGSFGCLIYLKPSDLDAACAVLAS